MTHILGAGLPVRWLDTLPANWLWNVVRQPQIILVHISSENKVNH